jgi:formate dehydrogenase alpha subunit
MNGKGKAHRPFGLRMIQLIYHSGKLSTQASGLIDISPNKKSLSMGTEDLKNLGLISGERIRLTSDQGTLEMTVSEDTSLMPGTCTVPEHFNDPPVKDLMPLHVDPITGVPYFKLAYVTIEKV